MLYMPNRSQYQPTPQVFNRICILGCSIKHVPVCIFLYADDIILLAPSVDALQRMVLSCEFELAILDMALNPKKSVCIRFGPRFDAKCAPLVTSCGQQLSWVKSCRYLGVFFFANRNFKCVFDNAKKAYYRSFNSIFGKVSHASEDVILKLIQSKCLPVILFGLDACPVNSSDRHSFDFLLTRSLMKIFKTGSNIIVTECRTAFNVKLLSEYIIERKKSFLYRYRNAENTICKLFYVDAVNELFNF